MVTFLITSLFILAFAAIAIYFWQKPAASTEREALGPPPGRGLFIDGTEGRTLLLAEAESEATQKNLTQNAELLERAKRGERSMLAEARDAGGAELYEQALNSLVAGADSDPSLLSLVSYVTRHELPVNGKLANRMIEAYRRAPDRSSTAKTLHIAALSNDAAIYQQAVETAFKFWRDGLLGEVSPQELRAILDGEFWVLSSPTRN